MCLCVYVCVCDGKALENMSKATLKKKKKTGPKLSYECQYIIVLWQIMDKP